MKFLYPIACILIVLIPWIIILWNQEKKFQIFRRERTQGNIFLELLYGKINQTEGKTIEKLRLFFLLILLALGILLIAHPVKVVEKENPLANGVDIVLVLDLSKSMLAEDIAPNRIESAKQAMEQFVQSSGHNRIGLVGFAGKPFVFSPLTFDTAGLTEIIKKITVDSIRQEISGLSGTAIGDGLLLATSTLEPEPGRKKIILLLTDGEANVGTDPRSVLPLLKEFGTTIYSIGIGNPNGTELYTTNAFGEKEYFTDANGIPIRATLDEKLMTLLSEQTGGKYVNIQSKDELIEALDEISKIYSKPLEIPKLLIYESTTQGLLWGIYFFLFLLFLLEQFDARSSFRIVGLLRKIPFEKYKDLIPKVSTSSMNYRISLPLFWSKIFSIVIIILFGFSSIFREIPVITPEKTILLVDISKSMNVRDISNGTSQISRLETAKKLAKSIIGGINSSPISIVLFGNGTRLEIPYTTDKNELLRSIDNIATGSLPGKTNISGAIQESLMLLGKSTNGQIILFTDGEDTITGASSRVYSSSKQSIQAFLIGTEEGGEIPIGTDAFGNEYVKSLNGQAIISKADKAPLQKLLPNAEIFEIDSLYDIPKSALVLARILGQGVGTTDFNWSIFVSTICGFLLLLFISLPYRRMQNGLPRESNKFTK